MQASGETSARENRSAFRKKNSKTVPGRASPARHASAESGTAANFQHFQQSVEDAWDDGDDEFCIISGKIQRDVKISENLAQSAALNVIQSHRKSSGGPNARRGSSEASPPPAQPAARPAVTAAGKAEAMIRLAAQRVEREAARLEKVGAAVKGGTATLDELRALCWGGIPAAVRPVAWRLLAGYLPLPLERREPTLCRKRDEYWSFVQQYYDTRHDDLHQDTYRQIHIDIPRMSPLIPLFQQLCVQQMFERVLYIWAIRHPASGYVQGVNDLLTPYFIVFLQEVLPPDADIESYDVASLPESERRVIEADSFWSMSLLLDGIQDNYTFAQPGIQTKVTQLKELVQRIDAPLDAHIVRHGIDYLQFAFRWMNNLLMRELPLHCTIRLWDTYLSETDGFASFHLYVCAAFLTSWSELLMRQRDFQGLMLTLQNLPTHNWTNSEVRVLVAEAFKLKYTFADAPNHLASRTK